MDPQQFWDAYAQKFGQALALEKLGARPESAVPESDRPGLIEGGVRSVAQGATFGTSDEAAGAVSGVGRALKTALPGGRPIGEAGSAFKEGYTETRDSERERAGQFREDHPVLSFAGEMAGGIATGGAAGTLARPLAGRAAAQSMRTLLAQGVAGGAAAGAGTAEGGPMERLRGAALGAGAGAGAAVGLKGASRALAPVGRAVSRAGGHVLDATGMRPATSANPLARAVESAEDRSSRKILEAMGRDRLSLSDVDAQRAAAGAKPTTLADFAPEEGNVAGLLRATKSMPGPAKADIAETLTARSEGEMGRVMGDIERRSGLTQRYVGDASEEIIERRRALAAPLYEKAHQILIRDRSGTITKTLEDPVFRSAFERARRIAAREGVEIPELYNEAGELTGANIPVVAFDYVKQGLDDVLSGMYHGGKLDRHEARGVRKMMKAMLSQVDDLVPEYKQARAVYAGESDLLDALNEGAEEFAKPNVRPEAIRARLAELTDGEREMYRRGAIDAIKGQLGSVTDDASQSNRLIRTPNLREKIQLLAKDDKEAAALMDDLGLERRMGQTKNKALAGSRTAEMLAEQADLLRAPELEIPTSAAGVGKLLAQPFMEQLNERARGFSEKVSAPLGQKLLAGAKGGDQGAADFQETLSLLRRYANQQAQAAARKRAAGSPVIQGAARSAGMSAGRSRGSLR